MKTLKTISIAALALMMAACSSDNDMQQPVQQPLGTKYFTATIAAPNSSDITRTTYTENGSGGIDVAWKVGDEVAFIYNGVKDVLEVTAVDNVTGAATIEGAITSNPDNNELVEMYYPAAFVSGMTGYLPDLDYSKWETQDGTLAYIQNNLDVRMATPYVTVSGSTISLKENAAFNSQAAIWKLTLTTDGTTPLAATEVKVKVGSTIVAAATSASAKSEYCIGLIPLHMGTGKLTIEATAGYNIYRYEKADGVSLANNKLYQSTLTMTQVGVDLSRLDENYTAPNGMILTGTLSGNYKVSIANDATVTLDNATINAGANSWHGITCVGNATIKLSGTNTVTASAENYSGIFVPKDYTLTIEGTGALTARANDHGTGIGSGSYSGKDGGNIIINSGTITAQGHMGAGIGSGTYANCGDITINGGTINALGYYGAGIGSCYASTCGDILITGGTIDASGYNTGYVGWAAGIGGANSNGCGSITITNGVTRVTATRSYNATYCIGKGYDGGSGVVTIGGTVYYDGTNWTSTELENSLKAASFTYQPS